MPFVEPLPATTYLCPGERHPISRSVHLGRLARCFPKCRRCRHHGDMGTLSPGRVKQLLEVQHRRAPRPLFQEEGMLGECPGELHPAVVQRAAVALAAFVQRHPLHPQRQPLLVVGSDSRPMTSALVAAAGEGVRWAGCRLVEIGEVNSACIAFAIDHLQADGGLLLGNPTGRASTAGVKFWAGGPQPLSAGGGLEEMAKLFESGMDRPTRAFGSRRRWAAWEPYLASLEESYHGLRPLRFVLAGRCAPAGDFVERLTRRVACKPIAVVGNMKTLSAQVVAHEAHFGFWIDDDGEVGWLFDQQGRAVEGDRLLTLVAGSLLAEHPRATLLLDRETPAAVVDWLTRQGAVVIEAGRSRAAVAQAMRDQGALFGGGSGGRFWYSVGHASPDALRTLTVLLAELSRSDRPLSEVLDRQGGLD